MHERIMRDISVIFYEFRVAPLWFMRNYDTNISRNKSSTFLSLETVAGLPAQTDISWRVFITQMALRLATLNM